MNIAIVSIICITALFITAIICNSAVKISQNKVVQSITDKIDPDDIVKVE